MYFDFFFFSSRRRHTRSLCDWSSDVCSSDLDDAVAERVHPRAERQDLLTFVTATHENMATAVARLPHERVDQPRLADARLALDDPDRATALPRFGEPLAQRRQFRQTADQGCLRLRDARCRLALVRPVRASGRRLKQLAIQPPRLRFRLEAQLTLEHPDARLVLAEGGSTPTLLRVELHERSMHRLLCWIECQQPEADAHRGLDRVRSDVMAEQLREDFHGQLAQSLPLGAQPVLERGLVDTDAL